MKDDTDNSANVPINPESAADQAQALLATRRILARARLELSDDSGSESSGGESANLSPEDAELLSGDTADRRRRDLATFAAWHDSLGNDPQAVLEELYGRLRERTGGGP